MLDVPDKRAARQIRISPEALSDIDETLAWTIDRFGEGAAVRYRNVIAKALRDVIAEPGRTESRARPELGENVRTYHLFFSRKSRGKVVIGSPRHFLVYRAFGDRVDILRLLHEDRDLARHLPWP